jgi:WXG100 family type VII secretion target
MADIIQADHEGLQSVATKFKQQSGDVSQMYQSVLSRMNRLKNDWIGHGSEAFFAEMEGEVLPAVRRLIEALAQASQVTHEISQLLGEADEEASSPFKNDTSAGTTAGAPNGAGVSAGGGIGAAGAPGAGGNDYGIPRDWLSGVTDSLQGYLKNNANDWGIPRDWLAGVTEGLGGSAGGEAGGQAAEAGQAGGSAGGGSGGGSGGDSGSESGGGSGAGAGSGGGTGETGAAETQPTYGGAGGGYSPQADISSPYSRPSDFAQGYFGGGGGTGAGSETGTGQSGPLHYQPFGGAAGGGGGGTEATTGGGSRSGAPAGGGAPAAPGATEGQGGLGLPFGLAAVSPFVALLGKAIKDRSNEKS